MKIEAEGHEPEVLIGMGKTPEKLSIFLLIILMNEDLVDKTTGSI